MYLAHHELESIIVIVVVVIAIVTLHEMQFKSLMCVFQAEDDLDAHEWMEAIQGVTACLLNGNVDIEALSKAQPKPSKPTHSRQGSRAGKPTPTSCIMHS